MAVVRLEYNETIRKYRGDRKISNHYSQIKFDVFHLISAGCIYKELLYLDICYFP